MKKGFTLAEVLITLGVIGVVAALTMPNLLQNHQKKVFVTQLQRTVNLISNSATQLLSDENAPTLADTYLVAVNNDYKNAQGKFMNTYFKVARDCGTDNQQACLGETYYSLDRSESFGIDHFIWSQIYCVTINTGATVCMGPMWPDETESWEENGKIVTRTYRGREYLIVDINGPSGPNTNGRDLFQIDMFTDGKLGNVYSSENNEHHFEYVASGQYCQDWKQYAGYGGSCFQHIMSNGWVMDY